MTDLRRFVLPWVALLAIVLPPAARADDPCHAPLVAVSQLSGGGSGVGGTGLEGGSGVGGTGLGDESGSGVGGTGLEGGSGVGGTGFSVYGTITALGSICVNGLRIVYASDVPVRVDGQPGDTSALVVGAVVWVDAEVSEQPRARRIDVLHALVGRIDAAEPGVARLTLLGKTVDVLPETRVAGDRNALLRPGRDVAVSGLWRDGDRVVATRIAPAAAGVARVGPRLGELVARGGRIARLSVEGYATSPSDRGLRVGGLDVATRVPPEVRPGQRVRAVGRLTAERVLQIERPLRPEKPPAPERPEKPERPPRIDRPEKIERPEVFDRPDIAPRPTTLR